jgi:hypothetical protein
VSPWLTPKTLRFANESALTVAITSQLVPATVAARPARAWRDDDGAVRVLPSERLSREQLKALAEAGADAVDDGEGGIEVCCWAEILPPRRIAEPAAIDSALFIVPDETSLLELAGEMLRLGCDRQQLRATDAMYLLRVVAPPYYTIARALDHDVGHAGGLRAFVGAGPVLTEIGWDHPLATLVRPAKGSLVLIGGDGRFAQLRDGNDWLDVYQQVELVLPPPVAPALPRPLSRKLAVPLSLARAGRSEPPSLWVVRDDPGTTIDAVTQLDALVQTLPDDVIDRLLFAPATAPDGTRLILVKARPGPKAPPELSLRARGYAPLLQIANLFVPSETSLEPPLRRDMIRKLLVPDDATLCWLEPVGEGGGFVVQSLSEAALTPLAEWVEYVIDRGAGALEPWVRGATFAFAEFESTGDESATAPPPAPALDDEPAPRPDKPRKKPRATASATESVAPPTLAKEPRALALAVAADAGPLAAELAELEQRFLALEAPADTPERQPLWLEMARLNTRLGRRRDAGLCWTRAVWEAAPMDADELAARWAEAEALAVVAPDARNALLAVPAPAAQISLHALEPPAANSLLAIEPPAAQSSLLAIEPPAAQSSLLAIEPPAAQSSLLAIEPAAALNALLAVPAPDREQIRALAALCHAGAETLRDRAAELTRFFDRFDEDLDLRSVWLARLALSRAVGGDALGLSRARDRVLGKLHRGLSVERDVPTFLRFVGGGERGGASAADRLGRALDALRALFDKTERSRSPVEAPLALTRAYVHLIFAYGLARLGQSDKARALAEAAVAPLDLADPVHGFLARAYRARIAHALEGLPPETPLPADVAGELNRLERFLRYKVDRLRQFSSVLEPQERLDPMGAFHRGEADPRGAELTSLRGETDAKKLATDVAALFARALVARPEDRARLFDGLMDFFPQLPESQALPQLETLVLSLDGIAPRARAQLYEEALMLAGHFGRGELVKQILARLTPLLAELGPEHVGDAASTVATSLRALRRVGLREEAAGLLAALGGAAHGEGTPLVLARLYLAGGNLYLGHAERARPALDEAQRRLGGDVTMAERLQLVRGVARAVTHAPEPLALETLAKLAQQLPRISDSFNTNSHFCLSVIAFMESLVLGYASEDLALGDLGRQWLDEDEYLIRRRVHRDLKANH